jgi:hypothetical protein
MGETPAAMRPKQKHAFFPRVARYGFSAIGDRERVIASSDCGFGTFAGWEWVAEDVVWAKLKSCREGADIATARLWGKKLHEAKRD